MCLMCLCVCVVCGGQKDSGTLLWCGRFCTERDCKQMNCKQINCKQKMSMHRDPRPLTSVFSAPSCPLPFLPEVCFFVCLFACLFVCWFSALSLLDYSLVYISTLYCVRCLFVFCLFVFVLICFFIIFFRLQYPELVVNTILTPVAKSASHIYSKHSSHTHTF